jgi:hypothetical protein
VKREERMKKESVKREERMREESVKKECVKKA